ncbi:hypothetical protein RvY_00740 [Ramazzottius varieornatus]|uniref:Uncharacterized protein n=1 Tax=Ramazzottius varieornatus TaxID=947166 RepID=A0A1D1UNM8_RAMVA|nr:hypothetical protein RvY_00740 [Ramazzottius varieornatus]
MRPVALSLPRLRDLFTSKAGLRYFFKDRVRDSYERQDLTCERCGGEFVQAVNESDIPVLMDPRIPRRTAQATVSPSPEEDDTYLNSLAPLRDALNDFARTLGSHGLPPVLNDRHASHSANRHALSLGFRLVREPTPTRQSTPMLSNLSSVVEEMSNDTEIMPPLTDSDDDDMPGLEPNEEQPNDLRNLFQPVRVHFQVNAPTPGQPQ